MDTITKLTFAQTLAALVSAAFSGLLIWQIKLTRRQIKQTDELQRIEAAFSYIPPDYFYECFNSFLNTFKNKGITLKARTEPLDEDDVAAILADPELEAQAMHFLGLLETIAVAINYRTMNDEIGYQLYSSYVLTWSNRFRPFINALVDRENDDEYFTELGKLAVAWKNRFDASGSAARVRTRLAARLRRQRKRRNTKARR